MTHGFVTVHLDIQAPWDFGDLWLASLKAAVEKVFQNRGDVYVIIENDPKADYVAMGGLKRGMPILHLNYEERSTFEEMLHSYLEAVLEHERGHIDCYNIMLKHDQLSAPRLFIRKEGKTTWGEHTKSFTNFLRDLLKDVEANCLMEPTSLSKYLEFESVKVLRAWRMFQVHSKVEIILLLAYIETCAEMGRVPVPSQLSVWAESLPETTEDRLIHTQAQRVFRAVWNAVKAKKQTVDVLEETGKLSDLCFQLSEPNFQL